MPIGRQFVIVLSLLCAAPALGQGARSGTWTDLGFGLAGSQGVPKLVGSGSLLPGSGVSLLLTDAHVSIDDWLVIGLVAAYAPFKGGTLVPDPVLIIPMVTDAFGTSQIGGVWPAGLPSGLTVYLQCWILDPVAPKGLAASNALLALTP
jgi:hypothetical protein